MATPGQIVLNSLTAGVSSLAAAYTNPSVADTDRVYIQFRKDVATKWITVNLDVSVDSGWNSAFTPWGLTADTGYDCRVRAVSDADGAGPWSAILSETTLNDTFSEPLIAWDEFGVRTGPFVDNTGQLDSSYDLDTKIGTGNQSNQVRNSRPCWQSDNTSGLSTGSLGSPILAQPCTIYCALQLFFIDANNRTIFYGHSFDTFLAPLEIRVQTGGFSLTSNGTGEYAKGIASTDGRLSVVECVIDDGSSSIRIMDDVGNDSGDIAVDIQFSDDFTPQALLWNTAMTTNADLPAQMYEVSVYDGFGTASERTARREELLQKWGINAPDLLDYRTATASITLDDTTATGTGTIGTVPPSGSSKTVASGVQVGIQL
jgi:hypothetical protein